MYFYTNKLESRLNSSRRCRLVSALEASENPQQEFATLLGRRYSSEEISAALWICTKKGLNDLIPTLISKFKLQRPAIKGQNLHGDSQFLFEHIGAAVEKGSLNTFKLLFKNLERIVERNNKKYNCRLQHIIDIAQMHNRVDILDFMSMQHTKGFIIPDQPDQPDQSDPFKHLLLLQFEAKNDHPQLSPRPAIPTAHVADHLDAKDDVEDGIPFAQIVESLPHLIVNAIDLTGLGQPIVGEGNGAPIVGEFPIYAIDDFGAPIIGNGAPVAQDVEQADMHVDENIEHEALQENGDEQDNNEQNIAAGAGFFNRCTIS